MNIEVPANIARAPGQVYPAQAKVDINMVYSGLLTGPDGEPVGGRILETGDTAHPERPVLDIGQDRVAQDHRAAGRQELRLRPVRRRQRRPLPLRVTEQGILLDDATIDFFLALAAFMARRPRARRAPRANSW